MTGDPKDRISAWMRSEFEVTVYGVVGATVGDSPIENVLFCAVWAVCEIHGVGLRRHKSGLGAPNGDMDAEQALKKLNYKDNECFIVYETQGAVERYRADFIFSAISDEKFKRLVVECDGHDYHERTKEQAAHDRGRDRRMQELGYTVFRFTGAEIHRDPIKCARQIVEWCGCL